MYWFFFVKIIKFQGLYQIGKKFFKIQMPDGSFRVAIDMICLIFIVFELLQIPLLLSFPEIETTEIDMISNFINFFFAADIIMNFNTAFYKRGVVVKKRKEIALYYLSHWFILGYLF